MAAEPEGLRPLNPHPRMPNPTTEEWNTLDPVEKTDLARCLLIDALGHWVSGPRPTSLSNRIELALWLLNDATNGAVERAASRMPTQAEIERLAARQPGVTP